MKLIILAAGKGTRFYPLTKEIPKGLIPINGRPLLEHVIDPYLKNISEIIFVINDDLGHKIEKHFGSVYQEKPILYKIQDTSHPKGTLSALLLCKDLVNNEETFCVSNCDDLLLEKDVVNAIKTNAPGIGISKAVMPWNYLGIDTDSSFVTGFRRHEKDDGEFVEDYFSNGFHILTPEIFDFIPVATKDGELGLPQTLFANSAKYPLRAFHFDKWQAVNGPENIEGAENFNL